MQIRYNKVSDANSAYQAVKENITEETIAQYKVKAKLDYNDSAKVIVASGKGFTLTMSFSDEEATIDLKLGLLLKALTGTVLSSLEKQLTRIL
jgi:hypothetical protein